MNTTESRKMARALLAARSAGRPIKSLAAYCPGLTVAQAYQVQAEQARMRTEAGEPATGWRLAGASVPARRAWGGEDPAFGRLFAQDCRAAYQAVSLEGLISPHAEPGIAFVLGADVAGPGVTGPDALRAVESVLPVLEITDSRIEGGPASAAEIIADNGGAGLVLLGVPRPYPVSTDLALAGCVLYRGGDIAATGAAGVGLGSPVNALAWLANVAGGQGVALRAGQLVLSGAITPPLPVHSGETVVASIAGLGRVIARLTP